MLLVVMSAVLFGAAPMMTDQSCADGGISISVEVVSDDTFVFTASEAGLWDFGDGSTVSGQASVTHTFMMSGLHRVSFTGLSGSGSAAALVTDKTPVTEAATGSLYNYCAGLGILTISTDCPGLSWDSWTRSLTGTPGAVGTYTVTVTPTSGSQSSFPLTVSQGVAQLDTAFDIASDGLTVFVKAHSSGTSGIQYTWIITDIVGNQVAFGYAAEQSFTLIEPGTYAVSCIVTDASFNSVESSQQITLSLDDEPREDEVPAWILAFILVVGILSFVTLVIL